MKKLIVFLSVLCASAPALGKSVSNLLADKKFGLTERISGDVLDLSNLGLKNLDGMQALIQNLGPAAQKITVLDLSGNAITTVKARTFEGLSGLTRLQLSRNKISKIEPNAFQGLANLEVLDLDRNNLTQKSIGAFGPIKKLTRVNLDKNKIQQPQDKIAVKRMIVKGSPLAQINV